MICGYGLRRLHVCIANVIQRYYSVSATSPQVELPLNYLNGARVDPVNSKDEFDLISPATGEIMRTVPSSGQGDIILAVESAKNAFLSWRRVIGFERGRILKKAADIIRERSEELARTEVLDTGKPIWEARFDILGCADTIEYYGGLAADIAGSVIQQTNGSFGYTIREALGVVGGIGAWNFPFQMAAWKSSPALACGNSIVFKPSPLTPLTAVMLGEIYAEAGLPEGCYNVVQGQGETGSILSNSDGISKMTFTGSVGTGEKIMQACAKGIKHISLELGGKSPLIVFSDCDIDEAVKGAMLANFLSQGQVCSNGTRVFVEKPIMKMFREKLIERTKQMKIDDPNKEDTTVGATISEEHATKVLNYIDLGKKEGAKCIYGGERVNMADSKLAGGYYLRPCIFTECADSMRIVQEEIFGSVLSLLEFDTEEEVVRRANNSDLGLAGGIFTKDLQRAHRVVSQLEAGSLYVNNYNAYPVGLPFGGYKKSGLGRENGPDTINYYTQLKSVYVEMNNIDCPF